MDYLAEDNFFLYAAKHYDNDQCYDESEFFEDLKRFKYIKRLLNSFVRDGDIKERLVLNHIVALVNVFGREPAVRMLFLKLGGYERYLIPFVSKLGILPDTVRALGVDARDVDTAAIAPDPAVSDILRRLDDAGTTNSGSRW